MEVDAASAMAYLVQQRSVAVGFPSSSTALALELPSQPSWGVEDQPAALILEAASGDLAASASQDPPRAYRSLSPAVSMRAFPLVAPLATVKTARRLLIVYPNGMNPARGQGDPKMIVNLTSPADETHFSRSSANGSSTVYVTQPAATILPNRN